MVIHTELTDKQQNDAYWAIVTGRNVVDKYLKETNTENEFNDMELQCLEVAVMLTSRIGYRMLYPTERFYDADTERTIFGEIVNIMENLNLYGMDLFHRADAHLRSALDITPQKEEE